MIIGQKKLWIRLMKIINFKNFFLFCILNINLVLTNELKIKAKVQILAPVKNIEDGFFNSKNNILKLVERFEDYQIIVYENNSTDQTKNLFLTWEKNDTKLKFLSENLSKEFIESFTPNTGDYRTELIARARNILISEATKTEYDEFEYVIMCDLDNFKEWDINQILSSILYPKKEWDVILPAATYDLYALRAKKFVVNTDLVSWNFWCKLQTRIGCLYSNFLKKNDWIQVESAFGGLAIFKKKSLIGIEYRGIIQPEYLDYILNKDCQNDILFQFSYSKIANEITNRKNELYKWKNSGFSKDFLPENPYVCEHVQFFFQMRKNGKDKIYINPNWTHVSLEHKNY